jgi:dolichol kinase
MHANFGLFFSMLNWVVPRSKFLPGMAMLTGGALVVELLRYKPGFEWMNDLAYKLVGSGIRKHEMEGKFTGILYFWSGVTLSAALYSKPCATLGIMQLAIADPSASYFGTKTKHVYWSRIERYVDEVNRDIFQFSFLFL